MTKYSYVYEDHSYETQQKAYNILRSVSEVKICRPGRHSWMALVEGMDGLICMKCGLHRWVVRGEVE